MDESNSAGTGAAESRKETMSSPLDLLGNPEVLRRLQAILGGGAATAPGGESRESASDGSAAAAEPLSSSGEAVASGTVPEAGENQAIPDGLSAILSDPAFLAKLPQMMAILKPAMASASGAVQTSATPGKHSGKDHAKPLSDCRDDLLLALKPFLSPERREAVDSILRISRLGQVLRQIR